MESTARAFVSMAGRGVHIWVCLFLLMLAVCLSVCLVESRPCHAAGTHSIAALEVFSRRFLYGRHGIFFCVKEVRARVWLRLLDVALLSVEGFFSK